MSRSTNPSGLRLIRCQNTFEREAYVHSVLLKVKDHDEQTRHLTVGYYVTQGYLQLKSREWVVIF